MLDRLRPILLIERIGAVVVVIVVASMFYFGRQMTDNPPFELSEHELNFESPWRMGDADVDLPLYLPQTGSVELTNALPEILSDAELVLFRQNQNAAVFVGGEKILETHRPTAHGVATKVGTQVVYVRLTRDMSGKDIKIRFFGGEYVFIDDIRLSYPSDYAVDFVRRYSPNITLIAFLLLAAILTVFIILAMLVSHGQDGIAFFIFAAVFFITAAIWLSTDIELFNIITGRQVLAAVLSYTLYSIIPLSLCLMLRSAMPDVLKGMSAAIAVAMILHIIAMTVLFTTGLLDLPAINITTRYLYAAQMIYAFASAFIITFGPRRDEHRGLRGAAFKFLSLGQGLLLLLFLSRRLLFVNHDYYQRLAVIGVFIFSVISILGAGAAIVCEMFSNYAELMNSKKYIYYDAMTSVKNRYAWEQKLSELSDAKIGSGLTLFICDINGLKRVNDDIGHAAGDQLIKDAAESLIAAFGGSDEIYRIGGDEFAAVRELREGEAEKIIEALRAETAKMSSASYGALAISIGCASAADVSAGDQAQRLASMKDVADKMMYADKARWYEETGADRRRRPMPAAV